jgi:hypothetical protein
MDDHEGMAGGDAMSDRRVRKIDLAEVVLGGESDAERNEHTQQREVDQVLCLGVLLKLPG